MPTIAWDDSIAVGNTLIDQQHQQLFRAINDLDQAIHGTAPDTDKVFQSLLFLIDYTRNHFAEEEGLMAECGYPGLEAHRAQHARLTQKLNDLSHLISRYSARDPLIAEELGAFLTGEWLRTHVIESDHQLIPYLAKLGKT